MKRRKAVKAVVVGGGGFVGSHVADELSDSGHDVTVFDMAESRWLRDDQTMVVGDLLDRDALRTAIEGASLVYHFAGIADIGESKSKPYDTINSNVMGTVNVLDAAVKANVERLIFASTMYVYGNLGSFYGASKQAAENMVSAYQKEFGMSFTFLRYGSLYGPRAQEWNGLRKYVHQILKNGCIDYNGTGHERREYIHVKDAARLSVQILDEQYKNKAITVTGQQVLTSVELLRMIFEIAGKQERINLEPAQSKSDHYVMTPYKHKPMAASKLVTNEFIDIGQGIADVVEEVHEALYRD